MATLTIRNVEDEVRQQLKINAARNGVSLEQELRTIVRHAARQPRREPRYDNLYDAIRDLVEPDGGFELDIPQRGLPGRDPPFKDWE